MAVILAALVAGLLIVNGSSHVPSRAAAADAGRCANPSAAAAADALAAKFDDHQFVFIGSTHGDLKLEQFLMCLVSRPSFHQHVTDIVVEWASSGHQELLDRYVMRLDPIEADRLAPIWLDTDQPTLWATLPQVRQFVETVRAVNGTLPPARRVRLLGGNDGVDWAKVRVAEDLAPYPFKTNWMPHLILDPWQRRQAIARSSCTETRTSAARETTSCPKSRALSAGPRSLSLAPFASSRRTSARPWPR